MDVSFSKTSFLFFFFFIFIRKQVEHQEENMGYNKGEAVKAAQTGLYFLKALLCYRRGKVHLFPPLSKGKLIKGQ